jgi:hypothetical protein
VTGSPVGAGWPPAVKDSRGLLSRFTLPSPGLLPGGFLWGVGGRVLGDHDQQVLGLGSVWPVFLADQARVLLGCDPETAVGVLDGLVDRGLLWRERLLPAGEPFYRVTVQGLEAVGSSLPAPTVDLVGLRRELGVVWLWLMARIGRLGKPVVSVSSRRELAVGLGMVQGPDVLVVTDRGWVAVHLLLGAPDLLLLRRVFMSYGSDPRFVEAIVYVEAESTGAAVQELVESLGLANMVRVRLAVL